jgi:hypothetical protein
VFAQFQRLPVTNDGSSISDPAIFPNSDSAACRCTLISDRLADVFETVVVIRKEHRRTKNRIFSNMNLVLCRDYAVSPKAAAVFQNDNSLLAFDVTGNIEPYISSNPNVITNHHRRRNASRQFAGVMYPNALANRSKRVCPTEPQRVQPVDYAGATRERSLHHLNK